MDLDFPPTLLNPYRINTPTNQSITYSIPFIGITIKKIISPLAFFDFDPDKRTKSGMEE